MTQSDSECIENARRIIAKAKELKQKTNPNTVFYLQLVRRIARRQRQIARLQAKIQQPLRIANSTGTATAHTRDGVTGSSHETYLTNITGGPTHDTT